MQGYIALAVNETKDVASSINLTSKERSSGYSAGTEFSHDKIDFKEYRSRWVASDVPAFKEEPYITTRKDYISKMNFEWSYIKFPDQPIKPVMGTWEDINRQFSDSPNFGGEITGNGFLKKIAEEDNCE